MTDTYRALVERLEAEAVAGEPVAHGPAYCCGQAADAITHLMEDKLDAENVIDQLQAQVDVERAENERLRATQTDGWGVLDIPPVHGEAYRRLLDLHERHGNYDTASALKTFHRLARYEAAEVVEGFGWNPAESDDPNEWVATNRPPRLPGHRSVTLLIHPGEE